MTDYYVVYVKFSVNSREYAYLCDDETVKPGDRVLVPSGIGRGTKALEVVRCAYVPEDKLPHLAEKMKKAVRQDAAPAGKTDQNRLPQEEAEDDLKLPDETYRKQIQEWTDPETQNCIAPPDSYETYRKLVLRGVKLDWPEALEALAYGSYGGNNVFAEDYSLAEYCLQRLIRVQEDPSPFYYNSLGYIYYYGRTNGGEPEYDKAYAYFSVGAVHGIFESMYRVADMLILGQGVPKNVQAGVIMLRRTYHRSRELLEQEIYDCKFTEAAVRMANLFENGTGLEKDPEGAYSFYLQAQFALSERMKITGNNGDEEIREKIERGLARTAAQLPEDFFQERVRAQAPYMIGTLLEGSDSGIDMAVAVKEGHTYLMARMARKENAEAEEPVKKHLFVLPELKFAAVTDMIMMEVVDVKSLELFYEESHVYVNHIGYDQEEECWYFSYMNYPMIKISCEGFLFEL